MNDFKPAHTKRIEPNYGALSVDALKKLETTQVEQIHTLEEVIKWLKGMATKEELLTKLTSISTPDVDKVVDAVNDLNESMNGKEVDWSPVLPWLERISDHLAAVPKELPEIPEQQQIDLTRTNELLESFGAALAKMELTAEAPVVNVEAPVVNVPKTELKVEKVDLTDLKKPLQALLDAFTAFKVPEPQVTDLSAVETLLNESNDLLGQIAKKPQGGGKSAGTSFQDETGKLVYVTLDNGAVPITGSITASASTLADFSVNDISEGTTSYFGNTKPDGTWLVKKLTDTSVSYATVSNNGAVTTYTDAWTNKATLTYGRFDEAF